MNERIRELHNKVFAESMNMRWNIEDAEKFAELIVRECAEQFHLVYTDEQYQRRIDKTILKHFGLYE